MRAGHNADAARLAVVLHEQGVEGDVPLYNVLLQAMLREGMEGEARSVLETMRNAALAPSEYTLNILLKSFVTNEGMAEALEIFNAFCGEGEGAMCVVPGLVSYNILIDGFARRGELLNAESIFAQLRSQGVVADVYTYNALMRAALVAGRTGRALAYHRFMGWQGVRADTTTLTLIADIYAEQARGAEAVGIARQALSQGFALDIGCARALMRACASGLPRLTQKRRPKAEAAEAAGTAPAEVTQAQLRERCREVLWLWNLGARAPALASLRADTGCVLSALRVLGAAGKWRTAMRVFEESTNREAGVWIDMIAICNRCGQPELASRLLLDPASPPQEQPAQPRSQEAQS